MTSMKNWASPTREELRTWAFCEISFPAQDWDWHLGKILSGEILEEVVNLSQDQNCPNRIFFLDVLYNSFEYGIKKILNDGGNFSAEEYLSIIMNTASESQDPLVKKWTRRSKSLLKNPEKFDSTTWRLNRYE